MFLRGVFVVNVALEGHQKQHLVDVERVDSVMAHDIGRSRRHQLIIFLGYGGHWDDMAQYRS